MFEAHLEQLKVRCGVAVVPIEKDNVLQMKKLKIQVETHPCIYVEFLISFYFLTDKAWDNFLLEAVSKYKGIHHS